MEKGKTQEGLQAIIQAVNNIIDPLVSTLKYDKTYRAKVIQRISVDTYKVQINNSEYQVVYKGFLNVGDVVKVKAPLNNFSDIYVEPLPSLNDGGVGADTLPIGATLEWYSDIEPKNWFLCNGQAISRTEYSELFTLLGTTFGAGDGQTTFNLPDLRGKSPIGFNSEDEDFNALGKTGGEKSHTLTVEELPSHYHKPGGNEGSFVSGGRVGISGANIQTGGAGYVIKETTGNTGGGKAHNNLSPYMVCNYIIKAKQTGAVVSTVVNNLDSTSTTDALSANQGRVLKGYIEDNDALINTLQTDIIQIEDEMINKIQKNGVDLPVTNKTVNVTVPTKTSELTNDGSGTNPFLEVIPVASDQNLGGIKVGSNLSITEDGVLSSTGGGSPVVEEITSFNSGKEITATVPDLSQYSLFVLQCTSKRADWILASTTFSYEEMKYYNRIDAAYAIEPNVYNTTMHYVSDTQLTITCVGTYDGMRLIGIRK